MRVLDRKVLRDLWNLRGAVAAICLVMASGTATFVMSLSTLDSLRRTQTNFYRQSRFGDLFASLKRAPQRLRATVQSIEGVQQVETRVLAPIKIDIENFSDPVSGLVVSIPDTGDSMLNRVHLRRGRMFEAGRDNEVIISESFADAHRFDIGDRLRIVINGHRKVVAIVGVGLSPEYIYQIRTGDVFPDFERFGVLWMARTPLANAFDMEGSFNDVTLTLTGQVPAQRVQDELDGLLRRYGGLGSYERQDQTSHRYLSEEFRQLEQMATIYPVIFLGVAAFLLNVVISRLVSTQREEIATLKAFGYANVSILFHYLKLVGSIALLGVLAGVALGVWFGRGLSGLYAEFYRFPSLEYHLRPEVAVTAALVSVGAALLGTLYSVRQAAIAPPAEAMRPEPPARYRETLVERLGLKRWLSQPARMMARNIERRPFKSLLTATGIAFAYAILIVGFFFNDAVDFMIKVQFGMAQREDLAVTFVEPTSRRALFELESLRGVDYGEVFRTVPARLRFQHRTYRTAIQGVQPGGDLYRLLDRDLKPILLPESGIVLTDYLGQILKVGPGDYLTVEVLEGSRPTREVPVAGLANQYLGVSAYMQVAALNRLMREGDAISGAYLAVDPLYENEIYEALEDTPRVASTVSQKIAIKNFYETMGENLLTFVFFFSLFAGSIAFGVVYNSARIALSERSRELASLRVLGFTRGEISYILLGELAVLTLSAIPIGLLIGRLLCAYIISELESDLFRFPLLIESRTYAFASSVVLLSATISALIVRRKLDHLDLVAVLKSRE